jgi:hypothetical protein
MRRRKKGLKKSVVFYFYFGGVANKRSCGNEVGFKGKYETIHYAMYSERHSIYLRTGFDG